MKYYSVIGWFHFRGIAYGDDEPYCRDTDTLLGPYKNFSEAKKEAIERYKESIKNAKAAIKYIKSMKKHDAVHWEDL